MLKNSPSIAVPLDRVICFWWLIIENKTTQRLPLTFPFFPATMGWFGGGSFGLGLLALPASARGCSLQVARRFGGILVWGWFFLCRSRLE